MSRLIIEFLLIAFWPFVLWAAFGWFSNRHKRLGSIWSGAPVKLMGFVSMASVLGLLAYYGTTTTYSTDAVYRPARIKDGKLVPGGFEKPKEKKSETAR